MGISARQSCNQKNSVPLYLSPDKCKSLQIGFFILSSCSPVILSTFHPKTQSLSIRPLTNVSRFRSHFSSCHPLSFCFPIVLSSCHLVILSSYHPVIFSSCHLVIQKTRFSSIRVQTNVSRSRSDFSSAVNLLSQSSFPPETIRPSKSKKLTISSPGKIFLASNGD